MGYLYTKCFDCNAVMSFRIERINCDDCGSSEIYDYCNDETENCCDNKKSKEYDDLFEDAKDTQ